MELTVMTYNIHHGKSVEKELNLDQIAHVIKESNADIIGLNEVDKNFHKRSEFEDQINWLAKELNMEQAFTHSISLKSKEKDTARQYGNGLLSKYPIVKKKDHHFNFVKGLVEGRSLLEATVQLDEKMIQVYVTHLSLIPFLQNKQTNYITNCLSECSHPKIIMGDWNMKPGSRTWEKMTDILVDAWETGGEEGAGYTYPSTQPKRRLDYIFMNTTFHIRNVEVVTTKPKASDHLPLKVTVFI
ncbi:endonuclease/exonuclease/phosphatase family protein [Ornithinibacillus caprae]|uniref:endonuclease/exonuclease/phosphatase family protein n=1 Tax=Ornithinibacillus caprae TaxID=2678566 RepID=UPI001FE56074|nr:endonuclease/exonuclease/phosphatase family protein [Ornithinibacillus caprae]